jgi:glutaredoxin
MNDKVEVIIYSRPGCHLCEEAKAAINSSGCDGSSYWKKSTLMTTRCFANDTARTYQ